jgi:hypothetical protein
MSTSLAGGVALAYVAGVVTVHRVAVARRRAVAHGYPTLKWLDWDALLEGVLPPAEAFEREVPSPVEGGPPPRILFRPPGQDTRVLEALISGRPLPEDDFESQHLSGGDAKWLQVLARTREEPLSVLEELENSALHTPAAVYLREWLNVQYRVSPFNMELLTFNAKRRLGQALRFFGDRPELYFVRAKASALLGLNSSVLDDVARAVYFSRQARFYVEAVLQMPGIEELRPALLHACQRSNDSTDKLSK